MKYWGGPYDGEEVHPAHEIVGRPGYRFPPVKDRQDAAGRLVVLPLGAYECYQLVQGAGTFAPSSGVRFEWRGTHVPVDPMSWVDGGNWREDV